MLKQVTHTVSMAAAAALLVVAPGVAHAQSSDTQAEEPGHMQGHMEGSSDMMDMSQSGLQMSCEQMQAKMQKMHDKAAKMQSKLDDMAAKIESTTGDAQQAAMAELLTTMVEQRKAMHDMMAKMQPMMMGHMMRHMHSSGDQAAMGGMSDCPMMKMASGGGDDSGDTGHSAHH